MADGVKVTNDMTGITGWGGLSHLALTRDYSSNINHLNDYIEVFTLRHGSCSYRV
jgi:hypothetical protein